MFEKGIRVELLDDNWSNEFNLMVMYVDQFMENSEILKLINSTLEFRFIKLGFRSELKTPVEYYGRSYDVIQVLNKFPDSIIYEIYKYFIGLFPTTPTILLNTAAGTDLELVPIPQYVTGLALYGLEADITYAEEYFSKCEDLQSAVVGPVLKGEIKENSKITSVKRLVCANTDLQARSLIFKFNGQVATFQRCRCDINVIIDVLKLWISNEAFQNVERLSINAMYNSSDNIPWWNEDVVLQAIETSPWDPSKRPENCDKKYQIVNWIIKPLKCGDFRDVTRKTDGKRASFHISEFLFYFVVWS